MSVKVIAEIGWNHMGDPGLARQMIEAANSSGADVVKFQYWDPVYLKPGAWDNDGRREIYNKAMLTPERITDLINVTESFGLEFLISVFGTKGAKLISDMGIKNIKIPSHETTNTALIEYCANTFDYVYFSAGASTVSEVEAASNLLRSGTADYCLMHCVSSYPCDDASANLPRINWLKELHSNVGYSDHTQSMVLPAAATAFGCSVIEKHFTTDKNLPGRDNKFALDAAEFAVMVSNIRSVEAALEFKGLDFQSIEADTVNNYRGRWEPHDYQR